MSKQQFVVGMKYQMEESGCIRMGLILGASFPEDGIFECHDVIDGWCYSKDILRDGEVLKEGTQIFPEGTLRGEYPDHQVTLVE